MGRGDQSSGSILAKGLIYAFANADTPPAKMVFFNGGARLTWGGEGSVSRGHPPTPRSAVARSLTCGTCLDFFGIKEKARRGGVTNLYAISSFPRP